MDTQKTVNTTNRHPKKIANATNRHPKKIANATNGHPKNDKYYKWTPKKKQILQMDTQLT